MFDLLKVLVVMLVVVILLGVLVGVVYALGEQMGMPGLEVGPAIQPIVNILVGK